MPLALMIASCKPANVVTAFSSTNSIGSSAPSPTLSAVMPFSSGGVSIRSCTGQTQLASANGCSEIFSDVSVAQAVVGSSVKHIINASARLKTRFFMDTVSS
ncbi:MAG: hypothetical protein MR419_03960 [Clostridiales bacterium]|nr:hypothetical protein [Clostridiales bacterium]MDY4171359.1 hypothetical protein [Evtepia sp.]